MKDSDISVSPASYNFGRVALGDTSTEQLFTVSNNGEGNLIIHAIGVSNTSFSKRKDSCKGQIIEPSGSCTVEMVYSPSWESGEDGFLFIASNDPDTAQFEIPLFGNYDLGGGGPIIGDCATYDPTTEMINIPLLDAGTLGKFEVILGPPHNIQSALPGIMPTCSEIPSYDPSTEALRIPWIDAGALGKFNVTLAPPYNIVSLIPK